MVKYVYMHHKSAFLFFYPVYLVKYVIQDGIFFFKKKEFLDQLFYTDNKLFLVKS